jgi:hypothetical protein
MYTFVTMVPRKAQAVPLCRYDFDNMALHSKNMSFRCSNGRLSKHGRLLIEQLPKDLYGLINYILPKQKGPIFRSRMTSKGRQYR